MASSYHQTFPLKSTSSEFLISSRDSRYSATFPLEIEFFTNLSEIAMFAHILSARMRQAGPRVPREKLSSILKGAGTAAPWNRLGDQQNSTRYFHWLNLAAGNLQFRDVSRDHAFFVEP
jgi:hypothetical protein